MTRSETRSEFAQDLAATARDFAEARTPPGRLFHDAALYERELETLFAEHWLCVGHQSRLLNRGDFFTVEVGRESVIVVLDNEGQANALLNVCRHRGTRVCTKSSGNTRGFVCPYHAWHYDLQGKLKAAPMMEQVPDFTRDEFPLRRLRIESFSGFLFINFSPQPQPLADQFSDFPDLQRFNIPTLERVAHHEYEVSANWKLICENYHECYHCRNAHPQLHRLSDHSGVSNADCSGDLFVGGPMAIRDGFNTLSDSGITTRGPLTNDQRDHQIVHYFNLLPNFLLSIAPDYLITHHIWPRGPERVFIESEWFFSKEQTSQVDFDPTDAVEFWDTTNQQDWALCENAQKGLRSSGHRPGRYQSGEDCTHRFDRWYVATLFPDLAG